MGCNDFPSPSTVYNTHDIQSVCAPRRVAYNTLYIYCTPPATPFIFRLWSNPIFPPLQLYTRVAQLSLPVQLPSSLSRRPFIYLIACMTQSKGSASTSKGIIPELWMGGALSPLYSILLYTYTILIFTAALFFFPPPPPTLPFILLRGARYSFRFCRRTKRAQHRPPTSSMLQFVRPHTHTHTHARSANSILISTVVTTAGSAAHPLSIRNVKDRERYSLFV